MSGLNSILSARAGDLAGIVIIHMVGLVAVSTLVALRRTTRNGRGTSAHGVTAARTTVPWHLYLAGVLGVGTVYACNVSFNAIGASLSVALALVGQLVGAMAVDATGFLGMKKHPFDARRLIGLALALAGVATMTEEWRLEFPFLALALLSGILTLCSLSINSLLAGRIGLLLGTRINFAVGLATALLIGFLAWLLSLFLPGSVMAQGGSASLLPALADLAAAGPAPIFGGGLLGVLVVVGMNRVFQVLPAFSASLLAFSGQVIAGLIFDFLRSPVLSFRKPLGVLILLCGLAVNLLVDRSRQASKGDRRQARGNS
jgi:transporter family-2 protein